MTDCPDCTQALASTWWGGYIATCTGCKARAIARSQCAFEARTNPTALRDTIARMLPELPADAAHEMVREWWKRDHAKKANA